MEPDEEMGKLESPEPGHSTHDPFALGFVQQSTYAYGEQTDTEPRQVSSFSSQREEFLGLLASPSCPNFIYLGK